MVRPSRPTRGRRRFLKLVGFATLTSAVGSSMLAFAQTSRPTATPSPTDTSKSATPAPPPISEDARALAAIVERRYGKHLNEKQLEAITREIENRLGGGKALRAVKLANADEPDVTFRA
jgi:hypothetical protein